MFQISGARPQGHVCEPAPWSLRRILPGALLAALVLVAPAAAPAQVLSGSYTGDGVDGRVIGSLGFQPDVVIVKGNAAQIGVIRSSSMAGDSSKAMTGATALTPNLVQSFISTGFSVGTDARVNNTGTEYYWIAFKQGSKRLKVGSYVGTGSAQGITGVGFAPEFVIVMSAGASEAIWRSSADTECFNFATSAGNTAWVSALGADGFTVGTDARVNTAGTTYHYVAWNEVDGVMDVGSYTGNGADPRQLTTTTFQPEYVLLKQDGAAEAVHHPASLGQAVDSTLPFTNAAAATNRIQQLNATGFQIGSNAAVNTGSSVYNYVAWRRVAKQTEILTGTYVGNGTDNRAITGLGFAPELVIVKGDDVQNGVLRAYTMSGDLTKDLIDGSMAADRIQSLDAEGFTVGTDARVNAAGVSYHWIAWIAGAGEMTFGTYTGNGTAGRAITDLGFSPDFLIVSGSSAEAVYRNSAAGASFSFDATRSTAWISAMGADGFTLGSDTRVNATGQPYSYVAWNEIPGTMDVGTYAGDGLDDRSITGLGFQPEYAFVQRDATGYNALHHPNSLGASTDSTLFFDDRGSFENYVQQLQSDGFQVGDQANINASGATYAYAAWKRPALTAVRMSSAGARRTDAGVTLTWRTGYEVDNLGFDVYRQRKDERVRLTSNPIAGSALYVPAGTPMTSGQTYTWTDDSPLALEQGVTYWIEDIDLNGTRTLHGPVSVAAPRPRARQSNTPRDHAPPATAGTGPEPLEAPASDSTTLQELARAAAAPAEEAAPALDRANNSAGLAIGAVPRSPVPRERRADAVAPSRTRAVARSVAPAGSPSAAPASATSSTPASSSPTTAMVGPAQSAPSASAPVASSPSAPANVRAVGSGTQSPAVASLSSTTPATSPQAVVSVPQRVRIQRPTSVIGGRPAPQPAERQQQWTLAAGAAARIDIAEAGWYRLTYAALTAAGIDPAANPGQLRLFTAGVEQPLALQHDGDDVFELGEAVEFYALGADTPYTGRRAYWLAAGSGAGLPLPVIDATGEGAPSGPSFPHTVERKDRQVFFAALQNGERENFFGPILMEGEPATQVLTLPHVFGGGSAAHVEVALQGVTALPTADDHRVAVLVNGHEVGELVFDGRTAAVAALPVPHSLLATGANTVTLETRGGGQDISLLDYVRLTYEREPRADADRVVATVRAGEQVTIAGFSTDRIRVLDITTGFASRELAGAVAPDGSGWAVTLTVPAGAERLFLTTNDAAASPAAVQANLPSTLHAPGAGGDVVMIADAAFASALTPLKSLRESQGHSVRIVDVQDIYDEFSFGQKTPEAIREFLMRAAEVWAKPPRFVLLVGNATTDPRNYQGLGEPDFVPARIVSTGAMETASDDWFVDADDDGFAELASIGRLPARSAADVARMVDKIVAYEQGSSESWHNTVLLVSDQGDAEPTEFSALNDAAGAVLPAGYQVTRVRRDLEVDAAAALRARLSEGALLMSYQGHGSVDLLRGNMLTAVDAGTLDNGSRLPLVVAMSCLAGFFHGLFPEESLSEALLRAPNGGAVGVWASSGFTDARWQASMNRELFRQMFRGQWASVGEAIRAAKKIVGDPDVRRTWIYFGDPALRIKGLSRRPVEGTASVTAIPAPPAPEDTEEEAGDDENRSSRAPRAPMRLADFDGDGRGDAFITRPDTGDWFAVLGGPGAFRHAPGQFLHSGEAVALNLNGDVHADLLLYNPDDGAWQQAVGVGDGTFLTWRGWWGVGLKVLTGDFDGNGRDDVFAHHPSGSWFQAQSVEGSDFRYQVGSGLQTGDAHAADFNADGRSDVFVYNETDGRWTLMLSTAGAPAVTTGTWTPGWQALVANLNGDGSADVALWHAASGTWVHCLRDPARSFVYRTGASSPGGRLHAADFSGDGRDELLRYDAGTGDWTLLAIAADGTVAQADGLWEAGWELTPGRLNADARDDLLLYNPDTGEWMRRLNLSSAWTDEASGVWSRGWFVAGVLR